MEDRLTQEEKKQVKSQIRGKYRKVSMDPGGLFAYPTGRAGLEILGYPPSFMNSLPDEMSRFYCGVGNPFSLGTLNKGETVLDLGCGVGIDALFAAMTIGASGKVFGIDLVPEMLDHARKNAKTLGIDNVSFMEGSAEKLNFKDEHFDTVISNGAINLIPDKKIALEEIFRVLTPDGRLMVADQVRVGSIEKDMKARLRSWFQWEGGAIPGEDFLAILQEVGFGSVELVAETGFNSSPKTKGVLIRAIKPHSTAFNQKKEEPLSSIDHRVATREYLVKRAVELGAKKVKIIDTDTIVVEKWVRWKCRYGCPMYEKDPYHPPLAPDVKETKEILQEYNAAILLNGPDGKKMTGIALQLEGEAYQMGYYKAFAMTALPSDFRTSGSASGATWPAGDNSASCEPTQSEKTDHRIRPMMEACGIDVFKTARRNGFEIDTRKETYGRWNFFSMVLVE